MLKVLLEELPKLWTDELYSDEFRASPSRYKDFDHALKHLRKAAQALENMTEEADHGGQPFKTSEVEKYLADLVICTVRLALKTPNGGVDIEKAIIERIQTKMGVKLELVEVCPECGTVTRCNHHDPLRRCQCSGEVGPCCKCS